MRAAFTPSCNSIRCRSNISRSRAARSCSYAPRAAVGSAPNAARVLARIFSAAIPARLPVRLARLLRASLMESETACGIAANICAAVCAPVDIARDMSLDICPIWLAKNLPTRGILLTLSLSHETRPDHALLMPSLIPLTTAPPIVRNALLTRPGRAVIPALIFPSNHTANVPISPAPAFMPLTIAVPTAFAAAIAIGMIRRIRPAIAPNALLTIALTPFTAPRKSPRRRATNVCITALIWLITGVTTARIALNAASITRRAVSLFLYRKISPAASAAAATTTSPMGFARSAIAPPMANAALRARTATASPVNASTAIFTTP